MTNKIQELTDKIFNEGVEKARIEADKIIEAAKKEAEQIISNAHKKENELIESAHNLATETKKNADTELKLAAKQFTSKLKQDISNCITTAQVNKPLEDTFKDNEFIREIILTLIKNWSAQKGESDLKLLLPESKQEELLEFLNTKTIDALNSGISIEYDTRIKSGFKIGPQNGSYVVSFEEKDFELFFKKHFREKTRKLLFD